MSAVTDGDIHDGDKSTFCNKHGSKLIVVSVWLIILIGVVIDQIYKPCDNFETNSTRVSRLTKANVPLLNNNNTTINCNSSKSGIASPYHLSKLDNRCHFLDACVNTLINYFIQWVRFNPALGAIILTLIYAIATMVFIPGSILTLGAGASFAAALGFLSGICVASFSVFIGASLGATGAFYLGRYVFYDCIQKKFIQKVRLMKAIDDSILEMPLTIMVLLRLSPLIPFNALNYIMSGSSIPAKDYVVGLLGMIPATVAYVFVGASIHAAAKASTQNQAPTTILFIVGGITALLAVVLISYYATKKIKSKMNDFDEDKEQIIAHHSGSDLEVPLENN
jgi:uncharacterized membrane protein YdjX (TVP38/TMEM64 family)